MEQEKWKLGDPCYVADVHRAQGRMRFRVMPARVVHVAGVTGRAATAQSVNPRPKLRLGYWEPFTEGRPFVGRLSAFMHVWREMRKNRISLFVPILFEGTAPEMKDFGMYSKSWLTANRISMGLWQQYAMDICRDNGNASKCFLCSIPSRFRRCLPLRHLIKSGWQLA